MAKSVTVLLAIFLLFSLAVAQISVEPMADPAGRLRVQVSFDPEIVSRPWRLVGYRLRAKGKLSLSNEVWLDGRPIAGGGVSGDAEGVLVVIGWLPEEKHHCGVMVGSWDWSLDGASGSVGCTGVSVQNAPWTELLLPASLKPNRPYLAYWMRWHDSEGQAHHLIQVIELHLHR
ncbi:hypothetical protein [Oceanithermus sp.]